MSTHVLWSNAAAKLGGDPQVEDHACPVEQRRGEARRRSTGGMTSLDVVAPILDAVLLEDWADAAAAALERHRAAIDRINVFPVADRDTGTNLLLTMRAAVAAVRSATVSVDAMVGGLPGAGRGAAATAD